ncbi:hypothetical protein LPY66_12965 [Dehalobacter sp. DCM]|uniref:hypothetical protein n=1 Tax=Dehalobacter sp. DCM TaxID=2907827 RepID=UPI0030812518|nr:hypothetical protein LPY66_12965 [Dehalobacter sp. DCM]
MNPLYNYQQLPWVDHATQYMQFGRILVGMEDSDKPKLDLYNYNYTMLPAYLIYSVLKIVLNDGWVEKLESLHAHRQNRWRVEVISHKISSEEYRLISDDGLNTYCSSFIAITQGNVMNFSIFAEDAAPILTKIIEKYPPVFLPKYRNFRYTYCFPQHPMWPGKIQLAGLPQQIIDQREKHQALTTKNCSLGSDAYEAGKSSGLVETIEAMKCLEVLLV